MLSPSRGAQPVFRFYNTTTGAHFYTISAADRDYVARALSAVRVRRHGVLRDARSREATAGSRCSASSTRRPARTSTRRRRPIATRCRRRCRSSPTRASRTTSTARTAFRCRRSRVPSSDGFRFLQQASFGPTPATLARVKAIGVPAYLEEQFALPASGYPDSRYNYLSLDESDDCSFSASAPERGLCLRARPADAVRAAQPVLHQRAHATGPAAPARGVGAVAVLRRLRA